MFCENCGNSLAEGTKFCENCGWKVPDGLGNENPVEGGDQQSVNQDFGGYTQQPVKQDFGGYTQQPVNQDFGGYTQQSVNQNYGGYTQQPVNQNYGGYTQQPVNQNYGGYTQQPVNQNIGGYEQSFTQNYGGGYTQSQMEQPGVTVVGDGIIPVQKKKKSFFKSPKFFICLGVVVAAAVVCCIIFWDYVSNFAVKAVTSPEKYYQYVEKKEAISLAEKTANTYGLYQENAKSADGKEMTGSYTIQLGEDAIDMLEEMASDSEEMTALGLDDLSWASSISLNYTVAMDDKKSSMEFVVSLGNAKIVTVNVVLDSENGMVYVQIPELNDDYLSFEINPYDAEELEEVMAVQENLMDALPSKEIVNRMIAKYAQCIIESVGDVEQGSSTLKAGGVSAKYTELSYKIDAKLIVNIIDNIYKTAKNDKDLKNTLEGFYDVAKSYDSYLDDFEDEYDELMEEFGDFVSEMKDEVKGNNQKLGNMTVWVNGKGEVVGREIKLGSKDDSVVVTYACPKNGAKEGLEISVEAYGDSYVELEGNGKESGGKLTGDYTLSVMDYELVDFSVSKFDKKLLEKDGFLSGEFTVSCGDDLADFVDDYIYSYDAYAFVEAIEGVSIHFEINQGDKEGSFKISILNGKESYGSIGCTVKVGDDANVSIPSNSLNGEYEDDLWQDGCDFQGFIDELDKSDFPEPLRNLLEELAESDLEDWAEIIDRYLYE